MFNTWLSATDADIKLANIESILTELWLKNHDNILNVNWTNMIHDVALAEQAGVPEVGVGVTVEEQRAIAELNKEERDRLDKKLMHARNVLDEIYKKLPETEVQFDENMIRKAAPQIAAPKNAREAFFQSQAKIKEAEKQNAAKKEEKAEEHRKAFLAHMAGKVVDAVKETAVKVVEAVKETGIKVVKAVKKTVVKAVKTVGKNLVELKESFLAKLKSLVSGEVA